uniref:nitroreductase n=1 Tax=Ensifer adhaerens TaxID=106592 RepID=UPI003F49382B
MIYLEPSPFDVLFSLAKARYSCRAFERTPVPMADIERVLEVARTAPSDCNTQPASMFIISGKALEWLRKDMYEAAAGGRERTSDVPPIGTYTGIFQERRRDCGWSLYNAVGIERGDREASGKQALENFRFFDAPHLAVVTVHNDLKERGLFDTGIYLGHFLLAAQALGISTVPQGAIAHYADIIRKHAPIPPELRVICGVSFGYDLKDHAANSFRTARAEISESVTFVS